LLYSEKQPVLPLLPEVQYRILPFKPFAVEFNNDLLIISAQKPISAITPYLNCTSDIFAFRNLALEIGVVKLMILNLDHKPFQPNLG